MGCSACRREGSEKTSFAAIKYLKAYKKVEKDFLPRTGCSGFKLKENMFTTNIRRKYCTVRW